MLFLTDGTVALQVKVSGTLPDAGNARCKAQHMVHKCLYMLQCTCCAHTVQCRDESKVGMWSPHGKLCHTHAHRVGCACTSGCMVGVCGLRPCLICLSAQANILQSAASGANYLDGMQTSACTLMLSTPSKLYCMIPRARSAMYQQVYLPCCTQHIPHTCAGIYDCSPLYVHIWLCIL